MKPAEPAASAGPSHEQLLYARVLDYGMKAGLGILVAGFAAYLSGVLSLQIALDELPRVWALPVGDYLREIGMATGWRWSAAFARGDVLAIAGIVVLAGVSIPCLMLLVPAYAAGGDRIYLAITLLLIGVLVLAASGALVAH